jgi:hypothetical protein
MNKVCLQIDLQLKVDHFISQLCKKASHLSIISSPSFILNSFLKTAKL